MADPAVEKELAHDTKDGTIARLAKGQRKWRDQAAKLVKERNDARAELAKAAADLVEARKSGTAVEELAALKAKVKADGHRAKFDELAKAAGARPKALDDLWNHSGYMADGDTPDEKAIAKLIEAQREQREWLFDGDGTEASADGRNPADVPPEPDRQPARPAVGRGQGGQARATGSQTQVTDAQLRDPAWCMANQARLVQVSKDVASLPISQVSGKFAIL